MRRTLIALLTALLAACGGGGVDLLEEADRSFVGPPDCHARPELCR